MVVHRGVLEPDGVPEVRHLHCERTELQGHRAELDAFAAEAVIDCRALTRRDAEMALRGRQNGFHEQRGRESAIGAFDRRSEGALAWRGPGRQLPLPHHPDVVLQRVGRWGRRSAEIHGGFPRPDEPGRERPAVTGRAAAQQTRRCDQC